MPRYPISRYADTVGDGTGIKDAIGDYSGAPVAFKIAPPNDVTYKVQRMIVFIKDQGNFDADKYGNNITLTNGIIIQVVRGETVLWNVTDDITVKTNTGWKKLCHDEIVSSYGVGDQNATYRYTFSKDGAPILLDGSSNEELRIILNDDFQGLTGHSFRIGFTKEYK